MDIKLYNTLTRKKEKFVPRVCGRVGMYHCGPTVYDYAHIGNFRAYLFADVLRRTFEYTGYEVTQVMNITDVGHLTSDGDEGADKMTKALKRAGKEISLEAMKEIADFYTEKFMTDLAALNIESAHVYPKASEHIQEQIALIEALEKKGAIYQTSDGVYFDTSKAKNYGALAQLDIARLKIGARIEANPEKKNAIDFALWKFDAALGWESPWGKGFPGWHLECSAMSMKYLGETFDIHTGGIDLIPIHHSNEIAQSETASGKTFVHYWLHSNFVDISGEKMAKSTGNFLTLRDLTDREFDPLAYRYLVLSAHYRTKINFTFEALQAAQNALGKLYHAAAQMPQSGGSTNIAYCEKFAAALASDIDTPSAVALTWKLIKNPEIAPADKYATLLDFDRVLGLRIGAQKKIPAEKIPQEITMLVSEREAARAVKDWVRSDTLRDQIAARGYQIKDTSTGIEIKKNI